MAMKCAKCECSVFEKPLTRVNPIGEDGVFWCWDCLRVYEPELYKNEKEDKTQIVKDLENIFYKHGEHGQRIADKNKTHNRKPIR